MHKKRKYLLSIAVLVIILVAVTWIDGERVKASKRPIFVVQTGTYKDGGSQRLSGLGYTVIDMHRISMVDIGGNEYRELIEVGYEFEHWIFPLRLRLVEPRWGDAITRDE